MGHMKKKRDLETFLKDDGEILDLPEQYIAKSNKKARSSVAEAAGYENVSHVTSTYDRILARDESRVHNGDQIQTNNIYCRLQSLCQDFNTD